MVLQKRLDYGFNGYTVPATPRATRSARKRVPFRKRVEDNQISAFDFTGHLEKNTVKEERLDGDQSLKLEPCNQGGTNREFVVSQLVLQTNDLNYSSREPPSLKNDTRFEFTSVITTSGCSERSNVLKLLNSKIKSETGSLPCKVETAFMCGTSGGRINLDSEKKGLIREELDRTDKVSIREVADTCPLKDPVVLDVSRDDDEKSSGCTYPGPIKKLFRPAPLIGDRKIEKTMASKYSKLDPIEGGDFIQFCEGISESPEQSINGNASVAYPKKQGSHRRITFISGPTQVIPVQGFPRVPELFIEIPESATVGSLKRTVMEAMTAVLGGGCIGVLFQGKSFPGHPLPLARHPTAPGFVVTHDSSPEHQMPNSGNFVESDHDSAPSPTDMSFDKSTTDTKALVAVPAMSVEALDVVPAHRKSKRSKVVQRRIRRPFSVAEVEALVQAVEKLGTGRNHLNPKKAGRASAPGALDRVLTAHAFWSQQQAKQQLKLPQQPESCLFLYNSTMRTSNRCDSDGKNLG
ncbi:TRF-like 2, putative isoform 2 [Hibiscus syriacus]|uniref:TRF-like 2, putative isoform 2 n=1 Tax=Hibiscus syriacus TaxID=106335 RepID=A0A6A3ARZ6_HIBSY|nr:TRF-like 2, putative isoform 2 [Hibiscus syriacus]